MEELIKQKIEEALQPELLEVINDSGRHKGHAGDDGSGQTHFRLKVVSNRFEGCNRIQRHRLVNNALNQLYTSGLHAVALSVFTPDEYQGK